jgi:uncharacterized protein (TIGR02145 family)
MKKRLTKFAQVAGIMLALVFTFSCSSDKDDDNSGGGGGDGGSNTQGSCPNATTGNGTLSCGGQTYKTVVIVSQTWMAENLNYNVNGSKCYAEGVSGVSADSIAKNCAKYGRLYSWATAKTVCPSGWHLPSNTDWNVLRKLINPSCPDELVTLGDFSCANVGTKLKATDGWNNNGNGQDTYEFAALPGGIGPGPNNKNSAFKDVGNQGYWWSATENDVYDAYGMTMYYDRDYATYIYASALLSVRCLKDN